MIRLQEYRVEQGGMVATALVAAARLGAEVEFLGAVGDDANGRLALDRFAAEGVATTGVQTLPGGISAFSFILVESHSGKRTIIHEPGVQRNRSLEIPRGDAKALLLGAVIQTLGERGAFVMVKDGQSFTVPSFPVRVVDTTGAGDGFHGGFVYALSRGYALREAVIFASAVAALKCTKLGGQSGLPPFKQVQGFLSERGILLP